MYYYIILLGLFIFSSDLIKSETISDECTNLLSQFSLSLSNFTNCAVINAKPVKLCENCANWYLDIKNNYKNLTKTLVNDTACIDNFINLDRLQIVYTLYKNANDLWNRAKCDECVLFENGTHTSTKVLVKFEQIYDNFTKCKNDYDGEFMCDICLDDYVQLNTYYISVGDITQGIEGLCMDIVDLMNKTQAEWSKTCCQYRVKNELIYIITTVFMLIIPILFYVLVKLFVDIKRPALSPQNRFAGSMNTPSASFRRESM